MNSNRLQINTSPSKMCEMRWHCWKIYYHLFQGIIYFLLLFSLAYRVNIGEVLSSLEARTFKKLLQRSSRTRWTQAKPFGGRGRTGRVLQGHAETVRPCSSLAPVQAMSVLLASWDIYIHIYINVYMHRERRGKEHTSKS